MSTVCLCQGKWKAYDMDILLDIIKSGSIFCFFSACYYFWSAILVFCAQKKEKTKEVPYMFMCILCPMKIIFLIGLHFKPIWFFLEFASSFSTFMNTPCAIHLSDLWLFFFLIFVLPSWQHNTFVFLLVS